MDNSVVKVVVLDFDGTLVPKDNDPRDLDVTTLGLLVQMREAGMKLYVATGRHPSYIQKRVRSFTFDGIIGYSGNVTRLGDEVIAYRFSYDDLRTFYRFVKRYDEVEVKLFTSDAVVIHESEMAKDRDLERLSGGKIIDLNGVEEAHITDFLEGRRYRDISRFCLRPKDIAMVPRIEEAFDKESNDFHFTKTGDRQMEMMRDGYSKAALVERIIKDLGVDKSEVVTIGDDDNDLEMLRDFPSYYVGPSDKDYLLEAADKTMPSCIAVLQEIIESRK